MPARTKESYPGRSQAYLVHVEVDLDKCTATVRPERVALECDRLPDFLKSPQFVKFTPTASRETFAFTILSPFSCSGVGPTRSPVGGD